MNTPPEFLEPQEEDAAIVELRTQIVGWLLAMSAEGTEPMVAAGKLFDVLVLMCEPAMGKGAIRAALLMTFEKTYDKPMTFIERNEAKDLLDAISNMRRKVEGKPHLILPGHDT